MDKFSKWLEKVKADFFKKEFASLKILFFLIYGASMAMFPFLTLQARSLGISEKELGIIYAFNPVVAILGPPMIGIIADKIGNFKILLGLTMSASGLASLLFLLVPYGRITHTLPVAINITITQQNNVILNTNAIQCDLKKHVDYGVLNCTKCGLDMNELKNKTSQDISNNINFYNITNEYNTEDEQNLAIVYNKSCNHECIIKSIDLCENTSWIQDVNSSYTFWLYFIIRVLNTMTLASSMTLFDGAVVAILQEHGGDYGLQRLYGNVGGIFLTPISGVLIDYFSQKSGEQDYRSVFYLYCVMKIIAALVIQAVSLDFRKGSSKVVQDFRYLMKQPEILAFLFSMLISGTSFGLIDIFLFWLLQDLGATKMLMGLTVTVGSIAGVPLLMVANIILKKIGHAYTIALAMIIYVVRLTGYSFLTSPWWCMPFEVLECFTFAMMSVAAVSYAAHLATPATLATLQGVYGGVHFGVGRGIGSLLGGFLLGPLGIRNTFRLMALICGCTGVSYFLIHLFYFSKKNKEKEKDGVEGGKEGREEGGVKEGKIEEKGGRKNGRGKEGREEEEKEGRKEERGGEEKEGREEEKKNVEIQQNIEMKKSGHSNQSYVKD